MQSSLSEVTNSADASSNMSRLQRDNVIRNQPLFLNVLSDQDRDESHMNHTTSKPVRKQVMQRTKQNPAKINRFIEKFGGGSSIE